MDRLTRSTAVMVVNRRWTRCLREPFRPASFSGRRKVLVRFSASKSATPGMISPQWARSQPVIPLCGYSEEHRGELGHLLKAAMLVRRPGRQVVVVDVQADRRRHAAQGVVDD